MESKTSNEIPSINLDKPNLYAVSTGKGFESLITYFLISLNDGEGPNQTIINPDIQENIKQANKMN